jgi:hypothetical protein
MVLWESLQVEVLNFDIWAQYILVFFLDVLILDDLEWEIDFVELKTQQMDSWSLQPRSWVFTLHTNAKLNGLTEITNRATAEKTLVWDLGSYKLLEVHQSLNI